MGWRLNDDEARLLVDLVARVYRRDPVCPRTGAPLPQDPAARAQVLLPEPADPGRGRLGDAARVCEWALANWPDAPVRAPGRVTGDGTLELTGAAQGVSVGEVAAELACVLARAREQLTAWFAARR